MLPNWYDEQPISSCAQCGTELFEGEGVLDCDGEYFCDRDCVLEYMGVKEIVL